MNKLFIHFLFWKLHVLFLICNNIKNIPLPKFQAAICNISSMIRHNIVLPLTVQNSVLMYMTFDCYDSAFQYYKLLCYFHMCVHVFILISRTEFFSDSIHLCSVEIAHVN